MFYDKTQVSKTNFFFSDLKWIWCGNKAKLTEWARIETFNYWRHFYFSLSFHVAQSNLLSPDKTVPLLCPKNYVTKVNQLDLHSPGEIISMWKCSDALKENWVIRKFMCFHFTCPFSCMCLYCACALEI